MTTDYPVALKVDSFSQAAGVTCVPGSKSVSNRALLLSALTRGHTILSGFLEADDTYIMRTALEALGVSIFDRKQELEIFGCAGVFPVQAARLDLGNAGTAFRFLTSALAFSGGHYHLDGVERMRSRPIGDLVEALIQLGANIKYQDRIGFPPLEVRPAHHVLANRVSIDPSVSSQFVSGILMAMPAIAPSEGLTICFKGEVISRPYVDLTLAMMHRFGANVERDEETLTVHPQVYCSPGRFEIESDASSASYFFAVGAIAGGPVCVSGLNRQSFQGDVCFVDVLESIGAVVKWGSHGIEVSSPNNKHLHPIDLDCNHIPDAAMTLAIVALFADGPSTLRNIGSWRVKETDRLSAMATELRKVGAEVEEGPDWIRITPPKKFLEATIDTYDDHRMAMCFSLVAAGGVPVHIRNPQCVSKTFPDYFERLAELVQH